MRRYIGEILLNIDDQHFSEAEDWINGAMEADSRTDMKWNLARDYALSADLYKRQKDKSKNKKSLSKAMKIFKECGARGWLNKNERDWSQLHNKDAFA